jgi:uncharacterized membrane protein YcaP (DUF421 family)
MDVQELLLTAGRSLLLYVIMLIVIRLLGKRTVGNFSAFDLLVALMLGEVVDEIIYGDVPFLVGIVSIIVIAAAKYATSWMTYKSDFLNSLMEGKPSLLVERGKISAKGLRKEIMNEKELLAALRLQGIDDITEVKLAALEVDGEVSVIKEDWAESVQKKDLEKRSSDSNTPNENRTDTKEALGIR